eukprot:CAMPEP_0198236292 /NCGR_PEP_ID=MMETSP1446-20131203/2187_1 /TAXON_ID=1461542 ORGANISM="Unidentified sp, Strain CCMP2111" /NCGR_SAMPLE_ID=MMETSP1446 /ASSEMBLY_ACC=CAM_ASM_001112 /LENGTH=41 /DNA_ID= /DNA_START= /DNA_END= /DNA_ORIENTATION=
MAWKAPASTSADSSSQPIASFFITATSTSMDLPLLRSTRCD